MTVSEKALPLLLKQLCLATIQKQWEALNEEAQKAHWTYPRYLAALCEMEVVHRQAQRLNRYLKESRLPSGKTVATFDFKTVSSINPAQIESITQNAGWIERAENILIFGPSGVGKTHLASAIGHGLIQLGIRTLFTSTMALVQQLQQAHKNYQLPEALNKLDRYQLLILDDIGYVKKDVSETSALFELIAKRYETGSVIITANQPFSEWHSIFPDNMMTVAAIDRLIHHATILSIPEESYRKKEAKLQQQKMDMGTRMEIETAKKGK